MLLFEVITFDLKTKNNFFYIFTAELESGASTFMARATMYKSRPWWKRFVVRNGH